MTETAEAAPQNNYVPMPLKDFQNTHCKHCSYSPSCDPTSIAMLNCILAAMLQAKAYRYKVFNERGW